MKNADLVINTDGASRGNPGPAGAGAVLYSADGVELAVVSRYLGETTNNQAEYKALEFALNEAIKLKAKKILIRADSELMVKQLNGEYKVKNAGIKPIFEKIKNKLAHFESWKAVHVRREKNSRADELANEAIDKKSYSGT